MMKITTLFVFSLMALGASALAMPPPLQMQSGSANQATRQTQTTMGVEPMDRAPTFRVTVISRTARAIDYKHRSGATKVDFKGTDLMANAHGQAKVESKQGYIEIEVEFRELQKPTTFGSEYLTYILWAITPEGRSVNLGEVLLNGHNSKLDVTTDLQAFALVVTAEPYYAVRRPSNVVVLENVIRTDTAGATEAVNAKYELLERGGYIPTGYKFDPVVLNARLPLEFFEARNAMRIAESEGAEKYAADSYANAARLMKQADGYAARKNIDKKPLTSVSRQVVQTAEDAREGAVNRLEALRLEDERIASAGREADAKAQTVEESKLRANAEAEAADAIRAREAAVSAREAAERKSRDDQAAAQQAARGQEAAEQASAVAQQQQQAAQAESERNRAAVATADQLRQQAEREREELRGRLLLQFNAILETHDTARGLVVNMSDVLFDTGKYTLRPLAREKLAKISGIVLAYPALQLAIEGNTDSVGGDVYNQGLSEKRAGAVMSYLAGQGLPASGMTAAGFGKTQPVASNDTAEGRQKNRRVELIVSGEVIGTKIGSLILQPDTPLTAR